MADAGVGRLLVASLHQAIVEVLPDRVEFYQYWLSPVGLRDGSIGLAPLAAVLSFLRQEGAPYDAVAVRAGRYAATWFVEGLSPLRRRLIGLTPRWLRLRLVVRLANAVFRATYRGSRGRISTRGGSRLVAIHGSVFCDVRHPVARPLCGFYASVVSHLMTEFSIDVSVATQQCRAAADGSSCLWTLADPLR